MKKHDFLKSTVRLCLVMMVGITIGTFAVAYMSGIPPDSGTVGVLMGGWCGELLLTLLKRMFEKEDKEIKKDEESNAISADGRTDQG